MNEQSGVEDLRVVLRELEWISEIRLSGVDRDATKGKCPICLQIKPGIPGFIDYEAVSPYGHKPDCKLAAAISSDQMQRARLEDGDHRLLVRVVSAKDYLHGNNASGG